MERFVQVTVDGLAAGSVYAALALALVLIFRATGVLNIAQGEMAMLSTFVAYTLVTAGLPLLLAVAATFVISFAAGALLERVVIRPFEGGDPLRIVIVTLGLFLVINSTAGWIWTYDTKRFPSVFPDERITVAGVQLTVESLGTAGLLVLVVAALTLLFQRTQIGRAMRAAAENPASSRLVGIPVGRMLTLGWGIAAALGSLAGILIAPRLFLDPNLMGGVLIYAFAAAALGGFDNPLGAVLGGWIVGLAEDWAGTYIDAIGQDLKILVPLAIIFVVLVLRPAGLLGTREVERA
ncbi:branched-chain amino acid ABC transporter permease [Actinomadura sp. NBRC 104412]|uniref:branched-chain amino acid ABC transporter permease n=1 Tax=Actinomadura sp. NBRC 104412 TaxID=3032203 RepID=UPI00249FF43F|nr:branched-chain amino acid ABC transporter permease [Actinomadura sp. NBRC 104412]GLZ09409.1 branched-chain amino acid ABC transporter permease [Actinomadura sp. NBRC 104412]